MTRWRTFSGSDVFLAACWMIPLAEFLGLAGREGLGSVVLIPPALWFFRRSGATFSPLRRFVWSSRSAHGTWR